MEVIFAKERDEWKRSRRWNLSQWKTWDPRSRFKLVSIRLSASIWSFSDPSLFPWLESYAVDKDNESTYSRHGIYPRTELIGSNYSQQLIPSDDLKVNKVNLKRSPIRHKIILAQFMRTILRYPLPSSRYLIAPPRWRSGEYPSFEGRRLS